MKIGDKNITSIKVGDKSVVSIYLGDKLVYPQVSPYSLSSWFRKFIE